MTRSSSITTLEIGLLLLVAVSPAAYSGFACLSNPCLHGVCLDDLNSTYFCYCIDGYTGLQCQTNWNDCWSSPCRNGGLCVDGIAGFNCTCPTGFVGDLCEEDLNECESNPCWNNGTCVDGTNGYSCQCLPGYLGVHCEVDEAVCNVTEEARCHNAGVCVEGPGDTFSCNCQQGWQGFLCDTEINECMSSPCENGAVCIDMHATYECACSFGFAGQNCEEMIKMCTHNPCKNGALCLLEDNLSVCYCVPDFHGELCQLQYDECLLGPKCANGGTCIDGVDEFTCSCPPNLTGLYCECLMLPGNRVDCTYVLPSTTTDYFINAATATTFETESLTTSFSGTVAVETGPVTATTLVTMFNGSTEATQTSLQTTEEATSLKSTKPEEEISSMPTTASEETSSFMSRTDGTLSHSTQAPTDVEVSIAATSSISETTSNDNLDSPTTTETTIGPNFSENTLVEELLTPTPLFSTDQPSTEEPGGYMGTTTSDSTVFATDTTISSSSGTDCTLPNEVCENGGTCIFSTGMHKCVCPFDSDGPRCTTKVGRKQAAFSGNSYLSHRLLQGQNISIEFKARTISSTGLIFDVNTGETYMDLYIENGYLMFRFSCGYQTMLLSELKVPINTGSWINVKASLDFSKDFNHCNAQIKVNGSLTMTGHQVAKLNKYSNTEAQLHLGGVPNDILHDGLPMEGGFIGCMSDLMVSGKPVHIQTDADESFGIAECSSLACLANPCRNGASCSAENEHWKCHCRNGFLGKTCEISICDNNPCLFGGTCVPFSNSGYICLCPYGKHGHFCENDLQISEAYFSSTVKGLSSFVAYALPGGISQRMEIKFRFTPTTVDQISLLLFIGQDGQHDSYSDHLAVSFVKGYILLTWNMGSGPRRIFTTQPVETGSRDYLVQVGYEGRQAWLAVENMVNVSGRAPGRSTQLDTTPLLYLGGHDALNFSTLPHDLPLHTGFSGCIFDVVVKIGSIMLPLQGNAIGRAVGQCGITECYERSCQNNGACLHHGSTFMCLCQEKWHGALCSSSTSFCDSSVTKCSNASRCVPLLTGYECDCPLGLVGRDCEIGENITDLSFTGTRSFLATHPLILDSTKFNIEMDIKILQDNGLLVFMGHKEASFVCLSIQSGLLELKLHSAKTRAYSKNLVTVRSSKLLLKGNWHRVQFGVFGRKVYLYVDHVINMGILDHDFMLILRRNSIYLGGLPDMSKLPISATSSFPVPYAGCLRHLSIDESKMPLIPENIMSARNVIDCDGTPCGGEACFNGGTCWLDSLTRPHCSCVEPYYGDKCQFFPKCTTQTCKNGKCHNLNCSCHVGFQGGFCETEIEVKTPAFVGNSYLTVHKLGDKKRDVTNLEIRKMYLNFTTAKNHGLLLWTKNNQHFFGLGLEKGLLKLVYSIDELENLVVEKAPYNKVADGFWHTLEFSFGPLWSLKIDGKSVGLFKNERAPPLNNAAVFSDGLFFIGGFPHHKDIFKETGGMFSGNFEGCVEAFGTNAEPLVTDFTPFEGANIINCHIF